MKYQIIGKNISVTEGIKNAVEEKLSKMDKYFIINDDVECRVVVRSYNVGAKVEVTIFTSQMTFRAEVYDKDLYDAVDEVIDKLERQMRKLKTRMNRKDEREGLGKSIAFENILEDEEVLEKEEVVRTKSFYLDPMDLEEAITRMEALGHDFFLYLDEEDERISVVYKRKDGGYGIIQSENKLA